MSNDRDSETIKTMQLDMECPFLSECKLKEGGCIDKYNGYIKSYKDLRNNNLYNGAGNKIISLRNILLLSKMNGYLVNIM